MKYAYLHMDHETLKSIVEENSGMTISVKLDDDGVVIDAIAGTEIVDSTWKTYGELEDDTIEPSYIGDDR